MKGISDLIKGTPGSSLNNFPPCSHVRYNKKVTLFLIEEKGPHQNPTM